MVVSAKANPRYYLAMSLPGTNSQSSDPRPPLAGLKVLEYACGVGGPYAGRLLASFGATVVKVEPEGGDPTRRLAVDDTPLPDGSTSPLYVHLNAAKHSVKSDEVSPSWAHLIISDQTLAQLDGAAIHPDRLRSLGPNHPKLVTVTPWGATSANTPAGFGDPADEILIQAATGFSAFNRDVDRGPLRLPGWQSQYAAGGLAASAALSVLRLPADHIDVSWYAAMLTTVEIVYFDALHTRRRRQPAGPHPVTAFPSGAIPCKDGYVNPGSIRPVDWEMQCLFYGIPEWIDDPGYANRLNRHDKIDTIWERIRPWYSERTKREIFQHALETPWAAGMVQTPTDALADEHIQARGLMGPIRVDGSTVTGPLAPVRARGLPIKDQWVSAPGSDPLPDPGPARSRQLTTFDGVRIIEMTLSWAGPYCGNILGPLGADVIKIESLSPFDGFRAQRPYDHGMKPGLEHLVDNNSFFDASGFFNSINKSKRSCVVTLATDEGREAFYELVRNCDALVANFSADVLPKLGLDFDTLSQINPRFVVVRAPAFGVEGPYSSCVGYGSIIEAMGGLAQRAGYDHEGARISNVYYPDPVSGIHIAASVMAGLDHAAATGRGIEIDLSQQDVTWLHSGEALVLASSQGRDIGRMGNRDPGAPVAGFWPTADGSIAVVAGHDASEATTKVLVTINTLDTAAALEAVEQAGGKAVAVTDPWTAPDQEPMQSRLETVDHIVTGTSTHIASPFTVDGQRPPQVRPAPCFDEHTDEIFSTIGGLSAEQIAALRQDGHIGGTLPNPAELGITG